MEYLLLISYIVVPPTVLYFSLRNIRLNRGQERSHLYAWLTHNYLTFLITLSFLPLLGWTNLDLGLVPVSPSSVWLVIVSFILAIVTVGWAQRKGVMYFYTGGVKAAFMEEILFRGVIYGLSLMIWQSITVALVVSAVSFSLWHLKNYSFIGKRVLWQVGYTLIAGFIFGWMRAETGDIYLGIFAHLLNNLVATLSPWLSKQRLTDIDYDRMES